MNKKMVVKMWTLGMAVIFFLSLFICSNVQAQWNRGPQMNFGSGAPWFGGGNFGYGGGMFGYGSSSSSTADVDVEEFLEDLADKFEDMFDLDPDDLLDELGLDADVDLEDVDWDDLRDAISDLMSEKMEEKKLTQFIDDMTEKFDDYCADDGNLGKFIGNLLAFINDVDEDDLEDYHENTEALLSDDYSGDYSDCADWTGYIAGWNDDNWTDLGQVYIEYFTTESKAFYTAYMENLEDQKNETNTNIDLGTWYGWAPGADEWNSLGNMGNIFSGMGGSGYNSGGWGGSSRYSMGNYGWGGSMGSMGYGGWGGNSGYGGSMGGYGGGSMRNFGWGGPMGGSGWGGNSGWGGFSGPWGFSGGGFPGWGAPWGNSEE